MTAEIRAAVSALSMQTPPRHSDGSWSEELSWAAFDALSEGGWTRVGLAESLGGAGGGVRDAAGVVGAYVSSGHLLPLADIGLPTTRLLSLAQIAVPADAVCVLAIPGLAELTDSVGLRFGRSRVPWGRWASHFVAVKADGKGAEVSLLDAKDADIRFGANLAGEPRDSVAFRDYKPLAATHVTMRPSELLTEVELAGALARSIQIDAAVERVLRLTVRYCADREQFGRPLRAFQSVQHELAGLASEAAASAAAVHAALERVEDGLTPWPVAAVATAKVRTSLAAGAAAKVGHQLHGAMGTALEHSLQQSTTALWSWRDEYGSEAYWSSRLFKELSGAASSPTWESLVRA